MCSKTTLTSSKGHVTKSHAHVTLTLDTKARMRITDKYFTTHVWFSGPADLLLIYNTVRESGSI